MEETLEFRDFNIIKNLKLDDEKVSTVTSREQVCVINFSNNLYKKYFFYNLAKNGKFYRKIFRPFSTNWYAR